jgi:AraC family transcriptional regulator, alkane utilization regulator
VDALSEVLTAIRLDGAVYVNAEFTAPWCVEAQYGLHSAVCRLPGTEHIIFFHLLMEGRCFVRLVDGDEIVGATAGDVLLFPHDHLHMLGTDLSLTPARTEEFIDVQSADGLIQMRYGGGGAATRFVCGYLSCDRRMCQPLLNALPQMLRIPLGDDSTDGWFADLLRLGVDESLAQRPGARSLLSKLSELAFVEALRRYVQSQPPGQKGWLAGLRDPHVGRALSLLHGDPARGWTVDELAREVALSRSALAERFVALIGEPPMKYLTRWRLALAAHSLRAGSDGIARIAERSAYLSEAAFTRAFKREFGMPPGAWRRNGGSGSSLSAPDHNSSG